MIRKGLLALVVSVLLSISTISVGATPTTTKVGLSQDLIYFVMPDRYKDGDKKNKDKRNLKTLCANCNRVYQKKLKEKRKSILDITIDTDLTI